MPTFHIQEAQKNLSHLLDRAMAGEEIIISIPGGPSVRMAPIATEHNERKPGGWEGKVWMAPDFDELPEDIARAFRGELS